MASYPPKAPLILLGLPAAAAGLALLLFFAFIPEREAEDALPIQNEIRLTESISTVLGKIDGAYAAFQPFTPEELASFVSAGQPADFSVSNQEILAPLEFDPESQTVSAVLPAAPRYRLIAWTDAGAIGEKTVTPPVFESAVPIEFDPPGDLELLPPTGVTLQVNSFGETPAAGRMFIRLQRSGQRDAFSQTAHRLAAPDLYGVYNSNPDEIEESAFPRPLAQSWLRAALNEELVMAPLFPDESLSLQILGPNGEPGEAITVGLEPGKIIRAEFLITDLFPDGLPECVPLSGTVVSGEDGSPIPEAKVSLLAPHKTEGGSMFASIWQVHDEHESLEFVYTDESGRFAFECVRPDHADITVSLPEPQEERHPLATNSSFTVENLPAGGRDDYTLEIPRLIWAQAVYPQELADRHRREASEGYPIYYLERRESGRIDPVPVKISHGEDSLHFAVEQQGEHRLAAALSPLTIEATDYAMILPGGENTLKFTAAESNEKAVKLAVRQAANDYPVEGFPLSVRTHSMGSQALTVTTNQEGFAPLPPLRSDRLLVSYRIAGQPMEREFSLTGGAEEVLTIELNSP